MSNVILDCFKNGPMVMLHVACNDPDSGIFDGTAGGIEIAYGGFDDSAQFSINYFDWYPTFTVDWKNRTVRIGGGKRIAYTERGTHVGNWCWDCFKIKREDAVSLLTWPRFRKWYSLDTAPTDFFEAYEALAPTPPTP